MSRLLCPALLVLAAAAPAQAATTVDQAPVRTPVKLTSAQSKQLWATVNFCDTANSPDSFGVAVSMPVIKKAKDMWARYRVQYFDAATETFKPVPYVGGDSYWEQVDEGRGKVRTAGHTFALSKPKYRSGYTVRAEVSFEWRKGRKVLLRAKRLTTPRHFTTANADPKGFSAATCTIKP